MTFYLKIFTLQPLGLCRPERPHLLPATPLVTTMSNLDHESYTSPVSWFEQVFFAPAALIVFHNTTEIQLRYQIVLFVTVAFDVRFGIR